MSFGKYFKKIRIEKNKTQSDIAKSINKSTMLISGVESGKNSPFSHEDLTKICDYLELTDTEKIELFVEAAVERGGVPEYLVAYMREYKSVYRLLNTLKEKNYDDNKISKLIDTLEEK